MTTRTLIVMFDLPSPIDCKEASWKFQDLENHHRSFNYHHCHHKPVSISWRSISLHNRDGEGLLHGRRRWWDKCYGTSHSAYHCSGAAGHLHPTSPACAGCCLSIPLLRNWRRWHLLQPWVGESMEFLIFVNLAVLFHVSNKNSIVMICWRCGADVHPKK